MGLFDFFKKNTFDTYDKQLPTQENHIALNSNYEKYKEVCANYYNGVDEIEAMWSVITNLELYNTEKGDVLIKKCLKNIEQLKEMQKQAKIINYDSSCPPHVPAYVRLAMIYEKREEYESGIAICIEAIKHGAINDGSKGKMYGRLARIIKKSGIIPSDEMQKYINCK